MRAKPIIEGTFSDPYEFPSEKRIQYLQAIRDEFHNQLWAMAEKVFITTGNRVAVKPAVSSSHEYSAMHLYVRSRHWQQANCGAVEAAMAARGERLEMVEPYFTLYNVDEISGTHSPLWRSSPGPSAIAIFETVGEAEIRVRKLIELDEKR